MPKKKNRELPRIKENVVVVPLLYANDWGSFDDGDSLLLDFGYISRSYYGEHELERAQVARIAISWADVEMFSDWLNDSVREHKRPDASRKPQRKGSSGG